jgi:lysophospholipase L1-like esterase
MDVPADAWSFSYIENTRSYLNDYVSRGGKRYFYPQLPITRGDLINALMKLIGADVRTADYGLLTAFADSENIKREWRAYAALALSKRVLNGYDDQTLRLEGQVTRREICSLITRSLEGLYKFPPAEQTRVYIPDLNSGFYDTFFDDAVFVGDSITIGLRNHVLNQRASGASPLGNARFLVAGSYGLRAAAGDFNPGGVNLSYQGVAKPLEDCVANMGTKDVYLMLGMNDWAGASLPGSIEKYEVIVNKVHSKIPGANVFLQSCTPVTKSREGEKLNNANTDKFNSAVVDLCMRYGIDYIDVATPMKDGQNAFKVEYASDNYVHLNASGCESWINTLREFACEKYLSGEWTGNTDQITPESYPGYWVSLDTD